MDLVCSLIRRRLSDKAGYLEAPKPVGIVERRDPCNSWRISCGEGNLSSTQAILNSGHLGFFFGYKFSYQFPFSPRVILQPPNYASFLHGIARPQVARSATGVRLHIFNS
jgi:hypothetical protein